MDAKKDGRTDEYINRHTGTERQKDRWMVGWMDGWMDKKGRWIDR
jgi:hypothetical protein